MTGEQGPIGWTGATCPQGEQGLQGIQGLQGEVGTEGPQGEQGPIGRTGATGPQGEKGPIGPIGPQGDKGDKGDTGNQGPIGLTGPIGPTGPQGPQGNIGPMGPQGPAGDPATDDQTLSTNNNPGHISISGGNTITLNVNDLDAIIGNEVTGATNGTLTRSGSGNTASPYTLAVTTGGITANELASNAVTSAKIADNAVTAAKIANNAVTNAKMADNAVGTAELINNSVTTAKISSGGNNKVLTTGASGTVGWTDRPIASRVFYPPSIAVDASSIGPKDPINLYTQYTAQFGSPAVSSVGAPTAIPTYDSGDLYYYVTYYDPTVFANVSISATGVMTYSVIAVPADYNSLINVVFVVK